MTSLPGRRVFAVVPALVVVALVVAVFVLRDSGADETASPESVETVPSDEAPEREHEDEDDHSHDHVDTVDPDIDPADYVPFCESFYLFADAYSMALDTLDEQGAPPFLMSAAQDFREVADDTEMDDDVRAGFEWFVDDVLRVPNDATTEEQLAYSTFLNSACPA